MGCWGGLQDSPGRNGMVEEVAGVFFQTDCMEILQPLYISVHFKGEHLSL